MFATIRTLLVPLALLAMTPATGGQTALAAAQEQAPAAGVEDPVAFVRSIYDQYIAGIAPADPSYAYSPELRALIDAALLEQQDEPGRLDFDFWISGQDWVIDAVDIAEEAGTGGERIVTAAFANQTVPTLIRFHFIEQDGRWFVDDVENLDGPLENRWRLRQILTEPPIVGTDDDAADWEIFYHGADGSDGAYRRSFSLRDNILHAELRARQVPHEANTSEAYFTVELNCRSKKGRMMGGRVIDSEGHVETRDEPEQWAAIRPDTPAAALHARLCPQ